MKYCSQCGSPLTEDFIDRKLRQNCKGCGNIVYHNPVPVGIVIAVKDDGILLIKRGNKPLHGYWAPPSGYIESDETLEEGAVREFHEETGYEVEIDGLMGIFSRRGTGIIFVAYRGRITGGEPKRDEDETLDMRFFSKGEMPVQDPPLNGPELDLWFFQVVSQLMLEFEKLFL